MKMSSLENADLSRITDLIRPHDHGCVYAMTSKIARFAQNLQNVQVILD